MKRIILLLTLLCLISCDYCEYATELDENNFEYILFDGLTLSDISEISEELETNQHQILNTLNVINMPIVTVKIWTNYDNFLHEMEADIGIRYTGATGYVFGKEELRIYYTNQAPITAIHEFVHLVSMQINETIPNNPRWLWEAVALYLTNDFIDPKSIPNMTSGEYPNLDELNTDYNSSNHSIYNVGYVLLEYIVQTWDMNTVIRLIETNGNIREVLEITVAEFELGWYSFIESEYL